MAADPTRAPPPGAPRPQALRSFVAVADMPTPAMAGRTAWARHLAAPVRDFLEAESGSAVALLGATLAALVWANVSPSSYEDLWTTQLSIEIGQHGISQDLRGWINDGLMT